ncbi:hypothetical protein ACFQ58_09025 [Agromyces sp. NPDC056523]|uniref:hypothetical protein n=1 Tax=Agromyces sp. NPDC056523 TaxID=3345850 RepID=UPI00366F151E
MRTTTTVTAAALVASAAALLSGIAAAPAVAIPDPGQWPAGHVQLVDHDRCELQRVGTQFVKCDDLTGAGVAAPSYIPEHP